MRLTHRYLALLATVPLVTTFAACGDEAVTDLQLGSGSTGGIYYPMGGEYANLFEEHADVEDLAVNSVESDASAENLAKISRGEYQMGLAQTNTAYEAMRGERDFEESGAIEGFGLLGQLYPEAISVVTLEGNGIDSVADLEGKDVAIGPPGSGTQGAALDILGAAGLEEGDISAHEEGFSDAQAKLQDGNVDASIEVMGVPNSGLEELESTTNRAKLVPLDDTIITEMSEGDFDEYEVPTDAYEFLDEPVPTITVYAAMFASTEDVDEDTGYELTRVMYENADDLTMDQAQYINPDDALRAAEDLPLHPGAERYFQEQGLLE